MQDEFEQAADAHESKVRTVKTKYKGLLKELDEQTQSDMISQKNNLERKFDKRIEELQLRHAEEVEQISNGVGVLENEMELLNKENEGE